MTMDVTDWFPWYEDENQRKWGVFDDDGVVIGIKSDAPDDIRRSYNAYKKGNAEYDRAYAQGILL